MTVSTRITADEALRLFDGSEPVPVEELTGFWLGAGIATGHWLDDLLESTGWIGKQFDGADAVHPLVHAGSFGRYRLNPDLLAMGLAKSVGLGRWPLVQPVFKVAGHLMATRKPKARLRMVEHRGKVSAAMIYNSKPIIDHFRRIDDGYVLGLMDRFGDEAPCFFTLKRDD